ncbi:MAG: hypothetical protein M1838_002828 [Thelocarpon superellum]|nr:MAG: hypothetical protein M1838_002828 [Thelocarpon superellum]
MTTAPVVGLDNSHLADQARKDLLNLLEGVRGKKNVVIQKSLAGTIGLFVKFSTLQDYGVDKVFFLENGNLDASQRNVVFIARGETAANAQAIAAQIKKLQQSSQIDHDFSVFWVPRRTLVGEKILEDAGVLGDVSLAEFSLYFIPLENDLLSLELHDSFADLYLHKDPTPTFMAAKALMLMQQRHGLFPRITGKGDHARRLADLLLRMRSEVAAGEEVSSTGGAIGGLAPSATIDNLLIIDREVDFATVLLTQLTYEGLVDELMHIRNNQAEIDSSIIGAAPTGQASQSPTNNNTSSLQSQQGMKRRIQLDSSDKLYHQLRDANFAIVGGILNKIARRLESDYESRHSAKSTSELREFVSKLPSFQNEQQSLKIHTSLAEEIMKHTRTDFFNRSLEVQQNLAAGADPASLHDIVDELIARDAPLATVLRLLCLESCVSGGLKPKDMETYKREILHAYGFQHLLTLHALERLQLLQSRSSATAALMIPSAASSTSAAGTKTNYTYLRKALRLIVDEVNEQDPNDIAYVYSGYAPLSVRLVQCVLQKQYLLSITKGGSAGGGGGGGGAGASGAGGGAGGTGTGASSNGVSSAAQGWRGFDEMIKYAKGKTVEEVQRGEDKAVRARMILNGQNERKTVVVFFLGGITYTEIAALRFIAKKEGGRRQIIICTTSVINGNSMMDAAIEHRGFGGDV